MMHASYFSLFDMAIAGVPVLIFCIWQLVSINREIGRDKMGDKKPPADSPDGAGHAVGEHGLDDR